MLATVKNINYWLSMDNCFVKASKSYEKNYKFAHKKFCEFPPRGLKSDKFVILKEKLKISISQVMKK